MPRHELDLPGNEIYEQVDVYNHIHVYRGYSDKRDLCMIGASLFGK